VTPAPERPDPLVTIDGDIVMVQLAGMSRSVALTDSMLSRLLLAAAPVTDTGLREAAEDVVLQRAERLAGGGLVLTSRIAMDRLEAALSRQAEKETA
jgi:hypothetical protein